MHRCYRLLRDEIRDPVDIDILTTLIEAPDCRKRSSELEKELFIKYKKVYSEESFHTHFNRCIKRLCAYGLVKKASLGHQRVFYYMPKNQRQAVKTDLEKMKNAKLFISLGTDEQQRLLSEVSFLRKREYLRKLFELPLPAYAVIAECTRKGIDSQKFSLVSSEKLDFHNTPESWRSSFPFSPSIEEKDKDDVEIQVLSDDDAADLVDPLKWKEKTKDYNELMRGWRILGKSSENTVLFGRLRILGRLFEETIDAILSYLKVFLRELPEKEWNLVEQNIRADPTILLTAEIPKYNGPSYP